MAKSHPNPRVWMQGWLLAAAGILLPVWTLGAPIQAGDLLRLLQGGVTEPVARAWIESAEAAGPPTSEDLLRLKEAGASDDLLVTFIRKSARSEAAASGRRAAGSRGVETGAGPAEAGAAGSSPGPVGHPVRGVERLDPETGRRVLELTNRAEDGSFPPLSPARPRPAPAAVVETPPRPEPPTPVLPSVRPAETVFEPGPSAPAAWVRGPVISERPRSRATLHIIPASRRSRYRGICRTRFHGRDGYHFPHFGHDVARVPTVLVFDFEVPFFRTPVAPEVFQPRLTGYQSRPVGFQHR